MKNFELFKAAFKNPRQLVAARKIGFSKVVVYFLILAVLSTLPVLKEAIQLFSQMKAETQEVLEKLPDFEVKNHELVTADEAKGFIYQGTLFTFTFDPEGKRDIKDIRSDTIQNKISIGMEPDKLVIYLPENAAFQQFASLIPEEITYASGDLDGFEKQDLTSLSKMIKLSPLSLGLAAVFLLYSLLISLVTNLFVLTISAWLYSKMRRLPLTFFENFKILVYVATVPLIATTVLSLIHSFSAATSLFLVATLMLYFYVVAPLAPPKSTDQNL